MGIRFGSETRNDLMQSKALLKYEVPDNLELNSYYTLSSWEQDEDIVYATSNSWTHNLKVSGSNPLPATKYFTHEFSPNYIKTAIGIEHKLFKIRNQSGL